MPLGKTLNGVACCVDKRLDALETDVEDIVETADALAAANAFGNATLVGGTIAVANTAITANSVVVAARKTIGGTPGNTSVVLNPGVGFTINSSSGTDTSVMSYVVHY